MGGPNETRAKFPSMDQGTQEDWQVISSHFMPFAGKVADRVLDHLRLLDGDFGGFPIDRLQHSLQTATRAHRDGRDEDYVVMALLHDIGDTLGTYNHPDVAAAILKPDRKSTRLNSSHDQISYAVFCLKKKKKQHNNHN